MDDWRNFVRTLWRMTHFPAAVYMPETQRYTAISHLESAGNPVYLTPAGGGRITETTEERLWIRVCLEAPGVSAVQFLGAAPLGPTQLADIAPQLLLRAAQKALYLLGVGAEGSIPQSLADQVVSFLSGTSRVPNSMAVAVAVATIGDRLDEFPEKGLACQVVRQCLLTLSSSQLNAHWTRAGMQVRLVAILRDLAKATGLAGGAKKLHQDFWARQENRRQLGDLVELLLGAE